MRRSIVSNRRKGKLRPQIERLEDRRLLFSNNLMAQFEGHLAVPNSQQQIPISLAAADFTLRGGKTVLVFQVQRDGGTFDPSAIKIVSASGAVVAARQSVPNLASNAQSLVVAELSLGNYTLLATGDNGSTGAFTINVLLAGDINGDRLVDLTDVTSVRNLLGVTSANPAYKIEADTNMDGVITSFDYTQARDNSSDSTRIKPLSSVSIALNPEPVVLSDGSLITNAHVVTAHGNTLPLMDIQLETGTDGNFDNGNTQSNGAGGFSIPNVGLSSGDVTIRARARDGFGQQAFNSISLVVDTEILTPLFDLTTGSDSGTQGDQVTSAGNVSFVGQTDPSASVSLLRAGITIANTIATGNGTFQFAGIQLATADNTFVVRAVDQAGNVQEFSRSFARVPDETLGPDVILRWNDIALDAIRLDASAPPVASRTLAMVGTAMFDAVSAIDGTPGYLVTLSPPSGASAEAAAAAAAHRVLSYLYPAQQSIFDAALESSLDPVGDGPSQISGISFGLAIADATIAQRENDGARNFIDYVPPDSNPGTWRPTSPAFAEALLPQWADVVPFALSSSDQFRPPAPPALNSAEYATAFNEVKLKGRATGSTRTNDESQTALYWAGGLGTSTPAGHWVQIAMQLADEVGYSLSANARLFAQLNVALADAAISSWDAKYAYGLWRPITAIGAAGSDGNSQTEADAQWTPFLVSPNFPSYTSGHSTFSGAAQVVLESFFGNSTSFTSPTEAIGITARTFSSFATAAEEAGRSRILGGIHFDFDNQAGLTVGRKVGAYVLDAFSLTGDTRAPVVKIQSPESELVTPTNIIIQGQAIDNLSGVKKVEARFDNGDFSPVTFSSVGNFSIPTTYSLDGTSDGPHTVTFRVTDFAGNVSSTQSYSFILDTVAPTITMITPQGNESLDEFSRISGTVSGTGSAVVALSYAFDAGEAAAVVFDPATGAFNQLFDLSTLAIGSHTLAVTVLDTGGHATTTTVEVSLAAAIPLTITEVSPAAGASEAGSTEKPRILFSRPIDKNTLDSNNFYATDTTGNRLPANIVIADDGIGAWLFFTSSMPGASTITVTVDGATIMADDSSLLDAAGNGTPGSKLTFSFTTVSLASLPGTSLTGILADPGPDLRPNTIDDLGRGSDGVLMTGDDVYLNPIANVRVYILGQESQAVFTDAQGRFTLPSVPSGNVKFVLDGMTASNAPAGSYFPEMVMDLMIEPGKVNTVMGSMGSRDQASASEEIRGIYLPRLKSAILQDVSDIVPTLIDVPAEAAPDLTAEQRALLTAVVQPGTAIGANGEVMTNVQLGISTVPPELIREMLPPGVSEPPFTITVQAPGVVTFTTPVAVSYPNVNNAAPGTKMLFISFNHATGRLEIDGTATVSADGQSVVTDPDSGITHPGWHFVQVGTPTAGQPCKPREVCVLAKGGRGDVIEVDLAGTGGKDFSKVTLSGGQVAYLTPDDVAKGHFYFVPDVGASATYAQGTFTGTLTRVNDQGVTETKTETGIVRVNVKDGYSAFNLLGSVGAGGANNKLDVYRVQQRLRFLHYPGESNAAVPVDGQNGTVLQQAIKIFQAATQAGGAGNPANEDGRVDVGGQTSGWLNASNAPQWKQVPQAYRSTAIGNEIWANSWTLDIVAAAGLGATVTSLSEYPDIGPTVHGEHKAGNDIDWDFNEALVPSNPVYPPATSLEQMLAGLTAGERDLVERVQAAHTAAGPLFVEVLVGGTGTQASYPRVRQVLTTLGISNRNVTGHHNHIHVSIQPPVQGAPAALADPDPSFVGQPGRIYYRIALSNGFGIIDQIDNAAQFNVVLTPNLSYTATFYQPLTNSWGIYSGKTNASGQITDLGMIILDQSGGLDTDGDELPDVGEGAIGTTSTLTDTDGDGVKDGAEIAQGLDPIDGRAFPTGVIATLPLQGSLERVAVDGDRVYAATGAFGLAVIDGTRFDGPIVLGQLDLTGTATDVAVNGNLGIAAVATGSALALVDVEDGMQPQLFRTVNVAATRVIVANGLAFAASGNQLSVVDLASGNLIQSLTLPGSGTLTGFAREGSFVYAYLSGSDTFSVIDIANEGAAVVRGQLSVSVASSDVGLFVGNGVAWLSGSGLRTINVNNPASPQIIQTPSGSQFFTARRVALNGSGLGLLLPDGGNYLQVYDTSNPSNVANLLLQLNLTGNARDVVVSRGVAYVATSSGLEVVNYLPFDNAGTAPTVTATTSAVDQNPTAPGLQVIEGTTIPVRVNVTDDVQVRNVELLVNVQVVQNDVSFPFDFFVAAPDIATVGSSFTIQVRANDTGGNASLSNQLTIELVEDTFAPTITGFVPPTNASVVEPIQVVQVRFSKPMAGASITSTAVRVLDSSNNVLTPTTFQLRDNDRLVQLTFPALLVGTYRIEVSGSVTDRAGNALGSDATSSFTLTPRASLATTVADADPGMPGLQVFEGTNIPLTVSLVPGVSVQKVELLVDGVVYATDTTAPYQFSAIAPNIAPGATTLTLQARVTDTAGLTTFTSPPLTIGLIEDIVAPSVVSSNPSNGSLTSVGRTSLQVGFSELLSLPSVSTSSFRLVKPGPDSVFGNGDDVAVPITSISSSANDTVLQLSVASLSGGAYQLQVLPGGITDRAGNLLTKAYSSTFSARSDLLAFYPFEQGAIDESGNAFNGTVNGAAPATGYLGQGYSFNGVNNSIRLPLNINPSVLPKLTMGAWVKASVGNPIRQVISHDNAGFDRSLGIDSRGGATGWSTFAGSGAVLGAPPVTLDQWTFIAVVYDQAAARVTLYVDGQVFQKAGSLGAGNTFTLIGSNPGFGEFFGGVIDNVFFVNAALTASELDTVRSHGFSSGLVSRYKADGDANDSVGASNGVLQNGATFAPGKSGQAFSFDGNNASIQVSNAPPVTSAIAVSAWINPQIPPAGQGWFYSLRSPFVSEGFSLAVLTNGSLRITLRTTTSPTNAGSSLVSSANRISFGVFQNVVASYDSANGQVKLFVDGVAIPLTTVSGPSILSGQLFPITNMFLGQRQSNATAEGAGGGVHYKGLIDDVQVFNRALSAADIQTILLGGGQPQYLLAGFGQPTVETAILTLDQLDAVRTRAFAILGAAGYDISPLPQIQFLISDLPESLLGWTFGNRIWIDQNAAGYGWFTDASGTSDAAFTNQTGQREFMAHFGLAQSRVDLLTVVTHEFGHVLGFDSIDASILDSNWMTATIGTGVRRYADPTRANAVSELSNPRTAKSAGIIESKEIALPYVSFVLNSWQDQDIADHENEIALNEALADDRTLTASVEQAILEPQWSLDWAALPIQERRQYGIERIDTEDTQLDDITAILNVIASDIAHFQIR